MRESPENDKTSLQIKISNIRKELKCWESLFSRSHGRRPNKDDIEASGNEIKGAYKEYHKLKERLNSQDGREPMYKSSNEKIVSSESKKEKEPDKCVNAEDDDGVFGKSFNKSEMKSSHKNSSHLKYHSIGEKHKTSFVKKRHLKVPAKVSKTETRNTLSENVDTRVTELKNDNQQKNADSKPEETEDKNDVVKEEQILKDIQITSIDADRPVFGRKTTIVSKKAGFSGRNFHLSKQWLEKMKPTVKEDNEEQFQPFEEFDQSMENEFGSSEVSRGKCSENESSLSEKKFDINSSTAIKILQSQGEENMTFPPSSCESTFTEINSKAKIIERDFTNNDTVEVANDGNFKNENCKKPNKNAIADRNADSCDKEFQDIEVADSNFLSSNTKMDLQIAPGKSAMVGGGRKSSKNSRLSSETQTNQKVPLLHPNDDVDMFNVVEKVSRKRKTLDSTNEVGEQIEEISNKSDGAVSRAKRLKTEGSNNVAPKASTGKRLVSENFVKIDIQKKKFCRGKRRIKASTYKRQQWKKKTQFDTKSTQKCYKCGSDGHWAKECGKRSTKGNPGRFSSYNGKKKEDYTPIHESEDAPGCFEFSLKDVPDLPRCWPRIPYHAPQCSPPVPPLFQPVDGQPSQDAFKEVNKALKTLGFNSFRQGQEETVARITSGLSTLLVLSTGSGKSLCYQLPAYMFYKKAKYLTLVISPLVALMEDQVGRMPYGLKGACLHTNMTKSQREKVLQDISDRKVAILLLSPEALVSGSSSEGFTPMLGSLPPVAFACIDEAHCVSEWSHNFRPNYLRVCKVLRDYLGINCFLGLTATSTKATATSIAKHLGIKESESEAATIRGPTMPDNLHITVSKDLHRDQALVSLLSGERFSLCTSIIIYCTRREETERLSSMLRTCLQNLPPTELDVDEDEESAKPKPKKRGKKSAKPKLRSVSWDADCYHAGMTPAQRRRVQKKFMSGELRIVVATTAFGMGLDKADVRAIIHYNMPKSFESFLQEIGRAGRDGLPAHCHIFLNEEAKDLCELRRHTYANSMDAKSIKRLVNRVFKTCDCRERSKDVQSKKPIHDVDNVPSAPAHCNEGLGNQNGIGNIDDDFHDKDFLEKCFQDNFDVDDLNQCQNGDLDDVTNLAAKAKMGCDAKDCSAVPDQINGCVPEGTEVEANNGAQLCNDNKMRICSGHHVTFSIQRTVQDLDVPEENIATLLSYLEFLLDPPVTLLNPVKSSCTLQCYGGARQMQQLAIRFLPVTAVFNHMRRNHLKLADSKAVTFNVVEVADEMGWDLEPIYRELRSVQWNTSFALSHNDSLVGKSGVLVEFDDPSFHVIAPGDLSDDEHDEVCSVLLRMVKDQEETRLLQLDALYNILDQSSNSTYHDVVDKDNPEANKQLREKIREYFKCEPTDMRSLLKRLSPQKIEIPVPECKWNAISRDVRIMLGLHHDVMFNGRALARIFHGIDSPCFPAFVWGRDKRFWRRYLDVDFNDLRVFITDEIIRYRT